MRRIRLGICAFLTIAMMSWCVPTWAAVSLLSIGNGNFTAAGTWSVCDATSENDSVSESTNATPPTAGGATSDSSTFTPPATAMQAVAIKLASVAGATGTLAISFRNNTSPGSRDFTVTVNMSDLPQNTAVSPLGWFVVKNGSSVTPNGTDGYVIRIVRSVGASSCTVYASSGNNWLREVRQAAASGAAPATGDKLIMSGEFTAAATSSTWTVTGDMTAATVYGTIAGGSITVGTKGIFSQQVSAGTYVLNLLGRFLVAGGGTWQNAGGTAMPAGSSLTVTFQNVANVDCGVEIGALGTVTLTGASLTFVSTKLAADAAAGATSLTTADSTGWANGDLIASPSTTRTASECESKALTAGASGTTLTITALTNAHSGTNNANGDIRGELANLTRNIKIQGLSSTLGSYVNVNATATVTLRYIEFTKIGSATASKRGIDVATTTGTFDCQFSSIHDCTVAGSRAWNVSSASGSTITVSSNVTHNIANSHFINVATSGVQTVSGNLCILETDANAAIFSFADVGGTYTNNTAAGGAFTGFLLNEFADIGTFSGNTAHSDANAGFQIGTVRNGTLSTLVSWRAASNGGILFQGPRGALILNTLTLFGNSTAGLVFQSQTTPMLIQSATVNAGATLTQANGLIINTGPVLNLYFENCSFGATTAHATADFSIAGGGANWNFTAYLYNCLLASATEVTGQGSTTVGTFIGSMKHDQVAGSYKAWMSEGVVTADAAIFDTTPSLRMTPAITSNSASKMASAPLGMGFLVPVKSGQALTVSIKVRKSVVGDGTAYGGAAPRLIVRKNVAAGITSDTVLATDGGSGSSSTTWGSGGTAELLKGATAAVTDDAVLEFFVDCDGTTGWVNIDLFAVNKGAAWGSLGTLKYWFNGTPSTGFGQPVTVRPH